MQSIALKNCNDGVTRTDNRAVGNFVAKTAAYTMTEYDLGDVISNKGASGAVTITLPAARHGAVARFVKHAQQNFTVKASGGAKIDGGTADASYANTAAEALKSLVLISDGTDWFIESSTGTWAAA